MATPDTPALGADEQDQQPTSGTAKEKKEGPLPPQTVVGEELGLAPSIFSVGMPESLWLLTAPPLDHDRSSTAQTMGKRTHRGKHRQLSTGSHAWEDANDFS